MMISKVLCDLCFSLNQPLTLADNYCIIILKNIIKTSRYIYIYVYIYVYIYIYINSVRLVFPVT